MLRLCVLQRVAGSIWPRASFVPNSCSRANRNEVDEVLVREAWSAHFQHSYLHCPRGLARPATMSHHSYAPPCATYCVRELAEPSNFQISAETSLGVHASKSAVEYSFFVEKCGRNCTGCSPTRITCILFYTFEAIWLLDPNLTFETPQHKLP
jgi:hypothetical protein